MNSDLNSLSTWASDWCVNFNASNTKPMLFTRKHDVNIPPLYMNDDVLEDVLKHTHLGIHFCPNGTWKHHINEIYKKACSRLNILRMMKHNLGRNSLEKLYFGFIRPILEYGRVVLG
jgi:hypothetical protein